VTSSFPGAAVHTCAPLSGPVDALISEAFASCPPTRRRCRVRASPPEAGGHDIEKLGAARCKQDRGRPRFTTRSSLQRTVKCVTCGVFFRPRADRPASDIPVASFVTLVPRGRSAIEEESAKAAKIGSAGAS